MKPNVARADVWGAAYAAAIAKQAMETAYTEIQAAILGTLKVTAYELLNTQIGQLIGGASYSETLIITDWEDFVVQAPMDEATLYINDFFSVSFQGKNTCDYVPAYSSSPTNDPYTDLVSSSCAAVDAVNEGVRFVQNFPSYMEDYARRAIGGVVAEGLDQVRQYTLDQFCTDPSEMFAAGNWKCWDAYFSNDYNNPYGYSSIAQQEYSYELEKKQELAKIQGMAYQGYKPQTTPEGYVITPGSLIKDIQSAVTDLGNKIIAAAESPGEFLSALVSSFVTSFIQQTIRSGVGQIQQHISSEIRSIDKKITSEVNRVIGEIGPKAQFYKLYQSNNSTWNSYYKGGGGSGSGGTTYSFLIRCEESSCCGTTRISNSFSTISACQSAYSNAMGSLKANCKYYYESC
ncbi:MAG: hypothetical protein IPN70_02400 [Candidatus Moraniibacteriota bacterium]|nr:MAG: hypothetical protein IPN70_02400 [Candidatus Moranbacteria bacterium]